MSGKTLKLRTEELLLDCLSKYEWIDEALYSYTNLLLDMSVNNTRFSKELEALTRLVSQYAIYLPPDHCSESFDWTERDKLDELYSIKGTLDNMLDESFPYVPFKSRLRIKTLESFFEKMWRRGSTPSKAEFDLKDLVAICFLLSGRTAEEFVPECFRIFDFIVGYLETHCGFKPIPGYTKGTKEFDPSNFDPSILYIPNEIPCDCKYIAQAKNYIMTPKANGYQGLQIALYSPQWNMYIEVQVKTLIMFENSVYFESSHDIAYKGEGGTAELETKLFDNYDLRKLNNLHGFRSRDGKKFIDHLGILTPRFY